MYKEFIINKKAVLFDLDGTITDTLPLWNKAFTNVLTTHDLGYIDVSVLVKRGGKILETAFEQAGKKLPLPIEDLNKQVYTEYLKLLEPAVIEVRPGFWELLHELKNEKKLKVGLITNSIKELADAMIKKLEIGGVWDAVVCGDEVKHIKPNPEMYHKAAKLLDVTPKECLVFEDALVGAEAAAKAGMDLVIIWDEQITQAEYKGHIFDFMYDFSKLPGNLDLTYKEALAEQLKNQNSM